MDPGIGQQRVADGFLRIRRYNTGATEFATHSVKDEKVHDLENAGDSLLRFVAIELLDA